MQTPKARNAANFRKWFLLSFLPRTIRGLFVSRPPVVFAVNERPGSRFLAVLRAANTARPTAMCRTMTWNGSDKGRRWHNYTTVYTALFAAAPAPRRIFELGLGTNNPSLVSSMGITGRPGASLRGWRTIFPDAAVFGADIDRAILFAEDGIETFFCDQLDRTAIAELWAQPRLAEGMDLLIEDGLHTFEANRCFLEGSIGAVRPGGTYVVEDIETHTLPAWRTLLEGEYAARFPETEFALVTLPNAANTQDNNMLVARRH